MRTPTPKLAALGISLVAAVIAFGGALLVPTTSPRTVYSARQSPFQAMLASAQSPAQPASDLVEMTVQDVMPIREASTHVVMLLSRDARVVLPIFVDEEGAIAIAFRLAHREPPTQLSADLVDALLSDLGGKVTEVRIEEQNAHAYRGQVTIEQGNKKHQVNATPSDSIAMALGSGARIFVTQRVMAQSGITKSDLEQMKQLPGIGGSGPPRAEPPSSHEEGFSL